MALLLEARSSRRAPARLFFFASVSIDIIVYEPSDHALVLGVMSRGL